MNRIVVFILLVMVGIGDIIAQSQQNLPSFFQVEGVGKEPPQFLNSEAWTQFRQDVFDNKVAGLNPLDSHGKAVFMAEERFWSEKFGAPGVFNYIRAMYVDENDLVYMGGFINRVSDGVESKVAHDLVVWDGTQYNPLHITINNDILSIVKFGDKVVIGGMFTRGIIGGFIVDVPFLAYWNGLELRKFDESPNGIVRSMVVMDEKLYIGGSFTKIGDVDQKGIAVFDGETWTGPNTDAMHFSASSDGVYAMFVHENEVYFGGRFASDEKPGFNVGRIQNDEIQELGNGLNNAVYSLTSYKNAVVAAGAFQADGQLETEMRFLAKWDSENETWEAFDNDVFSDIPIVVHGSGENLYVGGVFTSVDNMEARHIAYFDGDSWKAMDTGSPGVVYDIVTNSEGGVFRGGNPGANAVSLNHETFAIYENDTWTMPDRSAFQSIGYLTENNLLSAVSSVLPATTDGNSFYAGGHFSKIGGMPIDNIAYWDGSSWVAVGDGLRFDEEDNVFTGSVNGLAFHGENLVAIGTFNNLSGNTESIAVFDGVSWSSVPNAPAGTYLQIKAYEGDIYLSGFFIGSQSPGHHNILKWDGSTFTSVGAPLTLTGAVPYVHDFLIKDGYLYAGGDFDGVVGSTLEFENIARLSLDSNVWAMISPGAPGTVNTLAIHDDKLYAGGRVMVDSETSQRFLYAWSDNVRETVPGINAYYGQAIKSLASIQDDLYILVENFTNSGPSYITRLSDGMISDFITVPGQVNALNHNHTYLWVGGGFHSVGNVSSQRIGKMSHGVVFEAPPTPLSAPVLASPENASEVDPAEFTLTWYSVEGATNYDVVLFRDLESGIPDLFFQYGDTLAIFGDFPENTTYYWLVRAVNEETNSEWSAPWMFTTGLLTSVNRSDLPQNTELSQNYPNPFNPTTSIRYQLNQTEDVRLEVFDMMGRKVATLENGIKQAGYHSASFDASNLASGVYVYRLQAGNQVFTRQMVLIK